MSEDIKQHADTDSAEIKEGAEADNESGQEMKDEGKKLKPAYESPFRKSSVPLFLRDSSEGHKGNAQDEKDETGE